MTDRNRDAARRHPGLPPQHAAEIEARMADVPPPPAPHHDTEARTISMDEDDR